MSTGDELGVVCERLNGLAEVGGIGGRESRIGTGNRGEEIGFRKAEADTVGTANFVELGDVVVWNVNIAEADARFFEGRHLRQREWRETESSASNNGAERATGVVDA
jgi:hypothetical protein